MWVTFCPEEPGEEPGAPCFHGEKPLPHTSKENLSRRLAWPGEQELLLLFEGSSFNNNIVLPRFTGSKKNLTANGSPGSEHPRCRETAKSTHTLWRRANKKTGT